MKYKMVEGRTYAHVVKGGESHDIHSNIESIQIQPNGNGWLHRSAIAKIQRLLSIEELEKEFRLEKVIDVQIRALGGRFVIITFPNEESRDAIIKEKWVMN
ncbi:hypothetical protein RHMOL_Rhmol01G0292400 [Rhododendron molle]|uniref:Uncharacterized protein n=1 Tax=Rhododendron molle TaxID=49168 RepID=A0ACC0Q6L3_RHOML|nr:hypothetical protein RHMOL_Rhmol01G0292400 [Rhododendron molle]